MLDGAHTTERRSLVPRSSFSNPTIVLGLGRISGVSEPASIICWLALFHRSSQMSSRSSRLGSGLRLRLKPARLAFVALVYLVVSLLITYVHAQSAPTTTLSTNSSLDEAIVTAAQEDPPSWSISSSSAMPDPTESIPIPPPPAAEEQERDSSLALFLVLFLLIFSFFASYYLRVKRITAIHETIVGLFAGECGVGARSFLALVN